MYFRETAGTNPAKKTSSHVRTLEDVKKDMEREKQTVYSLRDAIEDYDSGWDDDNTPGKRDSLEKRLKTAQDSYARFEQELEHHPDYYADKYKDAGGFEKALTGILGSTIATVPVVVETTGAALKEAEKKGSATDYISALQAEEIARNKMNDYASSYFGSFDMIDPDELDRLSQEYQQAKEYRKSLEAKYEQPVSTDSWGMNLMKESAWLKNSATENLSGGWKTAADVAIDVGQGVALSPLLLAGSGAYTAGVAANAAAEDMYTQTAKGRTASDAFVSGALTAGAEAAGAKFSKMKNDVGAKAVKDAKEVISKIRRLGKDKVSVKKVVSILSSKPDLAKDLLKGFGFEVNRESRIYLTNYLADKLAHDPDAVFDPSEFARSAVFDKVSGLAEDKEKKILKEIERFWNTLG